MLQIDIWTLTCDGQVRPKTSSGRHAWTRSAPAASERLCAKRLRRHDSSKLGDLLLAAAIGGYEIEVDPARQVLRRVDFEEE